MMPLQDLNPTRRLPIATYILIGINVLVFLWEMTLSQSQLEQAFRDLSVVPATVSANPFSLDSVVAILRSMFLHGGYSHIFGNMLYLWLFGDNVEDRLGVVFYLILYFLSGFAAAIAQILIDPGSNVPLIGASGAIAGVLGSYLVMYPGVKVRGIVPIGRVSAMQEWPAFMVLGLWFVLQLFNGVTSLGAPTADGGVAFFAHIGGFVAGVVMTFVFMALVPQPPAEQRNNMLYRRAGQ